MKVEQVVREVWAIVAAEFRDVPHTLFLVGSRAAGTAGAFADIDFAIVGTTGIDPVRLARVRMRIDELPTLYSVDLVDFGSAGADFKSVAAKAMREVVDGRI